MDDDADTYGDSEQRSYRSDRSLSSNSQNLQPTASGARLKSKIVVAVRVRPLLPKEQEAGHARIVKVIGDKLVILMDKKRHIDGPNLRSRKPKEKRYVFDNAFSHEAPQEMIYTSTTSFLINSVLEGYNGTVFAYGATGSGKTYTMTGTEDDPGLMFLALQDLFHQTTLALRRGLQYKVTLSYLEIYNENIRDLVKGDGHFLELREHPTAGMRVSGITEYQVKNVEEIMELLILGNENRTTEPTEANAESSRSHAVLQVLLEQHDASNNQVKTAKLNLIDLAGSERGAVTQNRGARLLEGANINRSLLALGNCINALSDKGKISFVPYRDSKLTRLLKDSLGGNCNTVMITTVSPSHASIEESSNTLKYASRAKKIKNYVMCNEKTITYHVSKYEKLIADLQQQVSLLRSQLDAGVGTGVSSTTPAERQEYDDLRGVLMDSFNQRVQVRKQLSDIHELQLSQFLTISNTQTQADKSKLCGAISSEKEAAADLTIEASAKKIRRNEKLRVALNEKIKALEGEGKHLLKRVRGLASPDLRELLTHEYNARVLELENIELESKKQVQEQLSENKDAQMRRLQLHIRLRDAVINHQKEILTQHGVVASSLQTSYGLLSNLEESPSLSSTPQVQPQVPLSEVAILPPVPIAKGPQARAPYSAVPHQVVALPEVKHVPRGQSHPPVQATAGPPHPHLHASPPSVALLSASIQHKQKQQLRSPSALKAKAKPRGPEVGQKPAHHSNVYASRGPVPRGIARERKDVGPPLYASGVAANAFERDYEGRPVAKNDNLVAKVLHTTCGWKLAVGGV